MAMNRVMNIVPLQIKDHVVKCLCVAYSLIVGRRPGDHYRFTVLPVHFTVLAGYSVHVQCCGIDTYVIAWKDSHS